MLLSTLHEHILITNVFDLFSDFVYSSTCAQITREQLDLDNMIPYPPVIMIKLAIKKLPLVSECTKIVVDVLGITETGKKLY